MPIGSFGSIIFSISWEGVVLMVLQQSGRSEIIAEAG